MNSYQQLTQDLRYQIYAFLKAGFTPSAIARELGVAKSTISREVKRNRGLRGYRPKQAQQLAQSRRATDNAKRITADTWQQVEVYLRQDWSPEQISGTLKVQARATASHERICQYVYADKLFGGDLHKHLRCQKKRRKRYGSYDGRGQIINRKSIDERPAAVSNKERLGDWEIDTVIGKNHQQAAFNC